MRKGISAIRATIYPSFILYITAAIICESVIPKKIIRARNKYKENFFIRPPVYLNV